MKMLRDKHTIREITPENRVKKNLDIAFIKKHKSKTALLYKPLVVAASVVIIAIIISNLANLNGNDRSLTNNYDDTELINILLSLGRIENESSSIIPPLGIESPMKQLEQPIYSFEIQ